jgi:hypothetical protein
MRDPNYGDSYVHGKPVGHGIKLTLMQGMLEGRSFWFTSEQNDW